MSFGDVVLVISSFEGSISARPDFLGSSLSSDGVASRKTAADVLKAPHAAEPCGR